MNRRKFLKTSALATAGLTAASTLPIKKARAAVPARQYVFINLGGGWDSTQVCDPKPQYPATVDTPPGQMLSYGGGTFEVWDPILPNMPTGPNAPDSVVKQFFDAYWDQTCIIKGVGLRSVAHTICAERTYTGKQGGTSPDIPTIIGFETAQDLPVPYLNIRGPGWAGPLGAAVGRIGATGQLRTLIDPTRANWPLSFLPTLQDEADIERFHLANAERVRATRGSLGYNKARIDDFTESLGRADQLRDDGKNLNFGGGNLLGQLTTALSAFELGLTAVVMVNDGAGYDTHGGNNQAQGPAQSAVFGAIHTFLDELQLRPGSTPGSNMLDETCVIVMSEMTRTPRLNGGQGKDHWPVGCTFTVGAGVAGGTIVGDTGDAQRALQLDVATGSTTSGNLIFMGTETFAAGMVALAGVDPAPYFGSGTPVLTAHIAP